MLVVFGEPDARELYEPAALALAARGLAVTLADYPVTKPPLSPALIADAALATDQAARLAADHGGNPARLGVMGHGAGAALAMMITLDRRYMAAVDQPNLIRAAAGLAGDYGVGQRIDPTWTQPIAYVRPDAPSIWLGHGTADTLVPETETVTFHQHLRDSGGRSEIKLYPGLNHADLIVGSIAEQQVPQPVLDDVARFFRRALV